MPTWWIFAHTKPGVPTSADADLGPRLGQKAGPVELTNYETRIADSARLEVELEVEADDEEEAATAAYAWLADLCRRGRWLAEAGVTVDFDSEEPDADFTEIRDVFSIAAIERRSD